jgi:hypothetical protein
MHDQGIEARTSLGEKDCANRGGVGRIGGQAIDGLGRHGDQFTPPQRVDRGSNACSPGSWIFHGENPGQVCASCAIG